MAKFKLIVWLVLLLQQEWIYVMCTNGLAKPLISSSSDVLPAKNWLSIAGKSRQSRCVRCYENSYRNYEDRFRSPSTAGGGYGRLTDDRASSNWYYPNSERGEDRYRDYDRYDRYNPRGYDRNEGRDYERGYDNRGYDRYDDRRPSYYDRNDARGYDRLEYGGAQRGSESYYDRSIDRPADYGYERDYYDRYNTRYDMRNYRPVDETYRGQSGFDNTGRGYYFANDEAPPKDRRYLPQEDFNDRRYASQDDRRYLPERDRPSTPCGSRVANCPYDGSSRPGLGHVSQVSSRPINSNSASNNNKGSNVVNKDDDNNNNNNSNNNDPKGSNMRGNESQENDRQQSSAYGGRPPRPLGGSYLFDRETNAMVKDDYNEEPNNTGKIEASNDVKNNTK